MALEAIVSVVVGKLGDLLIEEARLLLSAQWFQMDCKIAEAYEKFSERADVKQKGDERVRSWVADIRDASYDAEEVIDTYIHHQITKIVRRRRWGLVAYLKGTFALLVNWQLAIGLAKKFSE